MNVKLYSYKGDKNIGIFFRASDKYLLAPLDADLKDVDKILDVEVVRIKIWDSPLIGLFTCMNSYGIILPKILFEEELKVFKSLGLNVLQLDSTFTAIGNLIVCNDKAAIVSPLIERENLKEIENTLNVEVIQRKIAKRNLVGSIAYATNNGIALYRDISEEEFNEIKEIFKVKNANIATVNKGSVYISSGIIANSKGLIVGEETTPIEIHSLQEAFGFI
ncbi:MAG: translation initiation factor IF-6 [Candidatus Aenigmatarchaeota archaeon]